MRLTLRQLEIVCAVADCRSISAAARALRISQPAVTRYLREIESECAVVLFDRTVRGVVATPFGEALVRRGHAILGEVRSVPSDFKSLKGLAKGRVAIGVTAAVPPAVLLLASRMRAEFPHLQVRLQEGTRAELLPALRSGELDAVVAPLFDEGPGEGLAERLLFYNRLSVIARWHHPLARRRRVTAAELADYDWIVPPVELPPHAQLDSAFHQARVAPPRKIITSGSFRIVRELLLASDCLSILVRDNIRQDEEHHLLRVLDVPLTLPLRPIGLIYRRTAVPSEPTARFIAMLGELAISQAVEQNPVGAAAV